MGASGRLSSEAYHLLHGLAAYDHRRRSCLTDSNVRRHAFWLENLGCQDLAEYLLPLPENSLPVADSSTSSVSSCIHSQLRTPLARSSPARSEMVPHDFQ